MTTHRRKRAPKRKVQIMSLSPRHALRRLATDERGLTTVEYVIVLCLIAAAAVGAWQKFGKTVSDGLDRADKDIKAEFKK
jgi:Flp pilus assembly pilin Flp